MPRLIAFLLLMSAGLLAQGAQDAPRTILVLDGSGSMWGQIDGVNKIEIARKVIVDLLATLPPEQELGLMTYGHRRKGDCSDIELIIEPSIDRNAIAQAVQAISPKGKTPLSAAVIQAAEALRYTEDMATVILVSDGIETCDLDPCAVGRELETAGVDFTAHVIGFDVADPAALEQLQCLAQETGGLFRTAANAEELADALDLVVAEPEPLIISAVVSFRAIAGAGGPEITEGLVWNIGTEAAGPIIVNGDEPTQLLDIFPSAGLAEVLRTADEATAEATFTVVDDTAMTVTLVLPALPPAALPDATVSGPATAPFGATIAVDWTGPNMANDHITLVPVGAKDDAKDARARTSDGNPARLRLPMETGAFEIRYLMTEGAKVLARQPITLTEVTASLDAPATINIGEEISVGWQGPDYDRDFIAIAKPGARDTAFETRAYTGNGNPARFKVPAEPGQYELRYAANDNGTRVIARQPLSVEEIKATLDAPETAVAGSTIQIGWSGPDAASDFIAVAKDRAGDSNRLNIVRTEKGNPAALVMPLKPGIYELRYVLEQNGEVLVRRQITVTPAAATLDAPEEATAGSLLPVGWTGPNYAGDYLAIAKPGAADDDYVDFVYAEKGSPARLQAPAQPGAYELRYIGAGRPDRVIAHREIMITEAKATLDAPASTPAGSTLSVGWNGPNADRNYIAIAKPDAPAETEETYEYCEKGSPLALRVPAVPGDYELRFILRSDVKAIIARQPLTVTAQTATLDAPASAPAGSSIEVNWTGPNVNRDYITVARVEQPAGDEETYEYCDKGSPMILKMPDEPGDYELRYIMRGISREIIARQPITAE
ncbi:vWA domain-containing protein [Thiorhodovibrio frisius]|uniref:Mg-chelatase subunit ChlD n=1 Tax=Thiorhodovibrio frisius TaxID=631362 RepID=H8Z445_9GAMM|nr:VWA domain-containing protein [Thiorhodovibrio frisius]EIC20114.1 Mg-chelatase subunit ChlD [Thiorhodovibrio frisius]WPL20848.1 cobaltochelatase subunit [Thiorhodovibrio frisius]